MRYQNINSALHVITTPTIDWLSQTAKECQSRLLIASPYVNRGVTELTNSVSTNVRKTLVTRIDLRDFATGSSDLETLRVLSRNGVAIRSLIGLHAKVYIFDSTYALVTSANATYAGMHQNRECGIGTWDGSVVRQLAKQLLQGFGADSPPRKVQIGELDSLLAPVAAIKAFQIQQRGLIEQQSAAVAIQIAYSADEAKLLDGFKGWLRLTLRGVIQMPRQGFHTSDLLKVLLPVAVAEYPRNQHIPDKLRQQLQILRDLGIVEFVSRGRYKCTLKISKS